MDGSHEGFGQQWHKMLAFGDQQRQIAYGNDITLKVKNYWFRVYLRKNTSLVAIKAK